VVAFFFFFFFFLLPGLIDKVLNSARDLPVAAPSFMKNL